jgi:predicted metal-dependent hydrolase
MSPLQMTLPWWDDDPAPAAVTEQPASLPPQPPAIWPSPSGMSITPTSSLRSSSSFEHTTPGGLAVFRHPEAAHEMRLGQTLVAFELKRCRRRSIGMVVSPEGLTVRAPRWATWSDIEQALQDKSRWICSKLVDQRDKGQKVAAARIDWCEGATIPIMGEPTIMVLDTRIEGCELHQSATALPGVPCQTLHIGLPQQATPEQIRDAVIGWVQASAHAHFQSRVAHYAAQLGVSVKRLMLSSARTRWGSASADGSVRLHWKLYHFTPQIIDYVVAHELAHLREMNHSPRFWSVVRSLMPDFDVPREQLRHVIIPD